MEERSRSETLTSGRERPDPAWVRRARAAARSRPGRAAGVLAACAVAAGLSVAAVREPAPDDPAVRITVHEAGPRPTFYASDQAVDGLDGRTFTASHDAIPYARFLPDAASGGETGVAFTVAARHASVAIDVRIENLACRKPSAGTILVAPLSFAAEPSRNLVIAYDLDDPELTPTVPSYDGEGYRFRGPLTLGQGESRDLEVLFHTLTRRCTFTAALHVVSDGVSTTLPLPRPWNAENGAAEGEFDVTATTTAYRRVYGFDTSGGLPLGGPRDYLVTAQRPADLAFLPDGAVLFADE